MRSFEAFELVYCFVNKVQFCSFFFTLNCIAKPVLVFFKSVIKFLRFYLWFFSYLFTKFSKGTTKSPKIDWGSTQCPFNVEFRAAINCYFKRTKSKIVLLSYAVAIAWALADRWKSCRNSFFRIFPAADFGIESTNWKRKKLDWNSLIGLIDHLYILQIQLHCLTPIPVTKKTPPSHKKRRRRRNYLA